MKNNANEKYFQDEESDQSRILILQKVIAHIFIHYILAVTEDFTAKRILYLADFPKLEKIFQHPI